MKNRPEGSRGVGDLKPDLDTQWTEAVRRWLPNEQTLPTTMRGMDVFRPWVFKLIVRWRDQDFGFAETATDQHIAHVPFDLVDKIAERAAIMYLQWRAGQPD